MTEPTFFWHDYETFGAVPRRDRPAQFAGLRTDLELNPIGEPVSFHCKPSDDFLPDPVSVLITGITPQRADELGVGEAEFVGRIHAELAAPGTCGVGYNTLRFDDELTRHLFWRNLYDPYAREWQHGGSRWDLLDCVRATYAFRPDGIAWPRRADSELPSFKLEHLTAANGLAHAAAHDALSDVQATVEFARLLRRLQPRLFDFCFRLRKKDAVAAEIGALDGHAFLHVSGMYPAAQGCLAPVAAIGWHPVNKNELAVWDLQYDPAELFELDAERIRARLFVRSEALAEGETRLPIKTIHLNKSPVVVSNLRTLSEPRAAELQLDMAQAQRHSARLAELLARHGKTLAATLREVYRRDEAAAVPRDVDEALYDGFVGDADRRRLDRLRAATPLELARSASAFDDGRLAELLFRYRARNWPDSLDANERARWQAHRAERLIDGGYGGYGGLSLAALREQLTLLRAERADDAAALALLDEVEAFAAAQTAGLG
ncbi:exodeoxyribonuclease I [Chitinimonas koreensis]|uniref:exodeoxyribonuclease I n=1 Tax=Chitinimonas koreensis TaxID=356302 RepID=UPI00040D9D56|nr:exodeoxyribonuclease I [Chitinimonas koreensis]QNM96141.1 exodeoxyribonuclease I [Chitinimonas koreensis]